MPAAVGISEDRLATRILAVATPRGYKNIGGFCKCWSFLGPITKANLAVVYFKMIRMID